MNVWQTSVWLTGVFLNIHGYMYDTDKLVYDWWECFLTFMTNHCKTDRGVYMMNYCMTDRSVSQQLWIHACTWWQTTVWQAGVFLNNHEYMYMTKYCVTDKECFSTTMNACTWWTTVWLTGAFLNICKYMYMSMCQKVLLRRWTLEWKIKAEKSFSK